MKTFYFVRAPLAGGGRHLTNLISLDQNIKQYCSKDLSTQQWAEFLLQEYAETNTAHYTDTKLISDPNWPSEATELMNAFDSVHHGHCASFDWTEKFLSELTKKKFVSLTFNSNASRDVLKKREKALFGTETLSNKFYTEEIAHFYNKQFKDNALCDDDVNLFFEVADLFRQDIAPLLEKINLHYNLQIPIDQAQQLHTVWFEKQKSYTK